MPVRNAYRATTRLIREAGGELVGRTRLQKVAFLAELAGFGEGFAFEYHHFGPYSEELASATEVAVALGLVREEERSADWGGKYSVYFSSEQNLSEQNDRRRFLLEAKRINAVELELAATAAYLFSVEGLGARIPGNPWTETQRRKPAKAADGRLERAYSAYERLRQYPMPTPLPSLPPP
jgi:uncharacterized protein YwgA